jgi:hypothetical protein
VVEAEAKVDSATGLTRYNERPRRMNGPISEQLSRHELNRVRPFVGVRSRNEVFAPFLVAGISNDVVYVLEAKRPQRQPQRAEALR